MKPEVTLKYLSYLRNKKNGEEGFTLIELLVVVIIIGVLAAVALPNLLGQVGKARETEGKNGIGTINRAQQAYHFEKGTFSDDFTDAQLQAANAIGVILPESKYYQFAVVGGTDSSNSSAQGTDGTGGAVDNGKAQGTRDFSGAVAFDGSGAYGQVICQADVTGTSVSTGIPGIGTANTCPNGSEIQ